MEQWRLDSGRQGKGSPVSCRAAKRWSCRHAAHVMRHAQQSAEQQYYSPCAREKKNKDKKRNARRKDATRRCARFTGVAGGGRVWLKNDSSSSLVSSFPSPAIEIPSSDTASCRWRFR